MTDRFDSFVVFAEMRTGSNFLEANLNAFDGLSCLGEVFNPHFIGYPNSTEVLGISQEVRDRDPMVLLNRIRERMPDGIGGFRFFHDHDPRVLPAILEDERCAKIVLTRNPVDSYVSWKIAQATGQWKLTNVSKRKESRVRFDGPEFEAHLEALQAFQVTLMNALQVSGQTAFYVAYEDLQDLQVMNGLARWLGVRSQLEGLNASLKRQNPEPVTEKVLNFDEMEGALARLDRFNLTRTPNFEPRRGPQVPSYLGGATTPLLFMPIKSGPEASVTRWLCALDGVEEDALARGFSQKTLRQWKRDREGHRSFTVVRHPLARAHDAFCSKVLTTGPGSYAGIRRTLRRAHALPIPEDEPDAGYSLSAHREAFEAFLLFLKANLAGQTAVRIDGHWASQAQVIHGMSELVHPDMVVREDEMLAYLPALALQVGHTTPPDPEKVPVAAPYALAEIYDDRLEAAARDAYARDYLMFGFADWG